MIKNTEEIESIESTFDNAAHDLILELNQEVGEEQTSEKK